MTESYYGQPVIKEPIWTWEIPCYFYTGGLAGASAGMAFLARDEDLSRRAWTTAMFGITASPALLVSDLGKPLRFLNMLRMFKVTSPMSVGSWILSASGAATTVAALNVWTGLLPRAARVARPAAAVLGMPLATYTAALVSNTAVPVWHEARRTLPFVFAAGSAASAGAAALAGGEHPMARRLAVGGAVAELATVRVMEKQLGSHGEPYHEGTPHRLGLAAKALTAAGAAALAFGPRRAPVRLAGCALISAGAMCERWTIFKAGFASAADPKYTVGPQRERIARGETRGAARRVSRIAQPDAKLGSPATGDIQPASNPPVTSG